MDDAQMAGIGVDEGPPYGIIIGVCAVIFLYVLHSLYTSWQEKRSAARLVSREDVAEKRTAHLARLQSGSPNSSSKYDENKTSDAAVSSTSTLRHRTDNYSVKSDKEQELSSQNRVNKSQKTDVMRGLNASDTTHASGVSRGSNHGQVKGESSSTHMEISKDMPPKPTWERPQKTQDQNTAENSQNKDKSENKEIAGLKEVNGSRKGKSSAPATMQKTVSLERRAQKIPELGSPEWHDWMAQLLSRVLSVDVRISNQRGGQGYAIPVSDLPTQEEDVNRKCTRIFVRRLAGEFSIGKLHFAINTWSRAEEERSQVLGDELLLAILGSLQIQAIETIFAQLKLVEDDDDDDLYASPTGGDKLQTAGFIFIKMAGGWDEKGVSVSPELLTAILQLAGQSHHYRDILLSMVQSLGLSLSQVHCTDHLTLYSYMQAIDGIQALLTEPLMIQMMSQRLKHEVKESKLALGLYFEKESILGSLLTLSTISPTLEDGIDSQSPAAQAWLQLPKFPLVNGHDLAELEDIFHKRARRMIEIVARCLTSLVKLNRPLTMEWLSMVVSLNESRCHVVEQVRKRDGSADSLQVTCGDGFMVNLCGVLLKLCLPFCGKVDKLAKIKMEYPTSPECRLNYDFESCLAGGMIVRDSSSDATSEMENESGDQNERLINADDGKTQTAKDSESTFNFMTEIFHITLRAMNIGYFPATIHYEKLLRIIDQILKIQPGSKEQNPRKTLFVLRWQVSLFEKELMEQGSFLYVSLAQWFKMNMDQCTSQEDGKVTDAVAKQQRHLLANLPEFYVKDMSTWFYNVAVHAGYNPVRGTIFSNILIKNSIHEFVDCSISLLQRQDLMPGPIPAWKITRAFHAFVRSARNDRNRKVSSDMASCILAAPNTEQYLGPALIHHYVSVSIVQGIDVDKEAFDKYQARGDIGQMIQILWEQIRSRDSILQLCGTPQFQEFLGTILDTLLYMLHDSIARISEVEKLEAVKKDAATWEALSYQERAQKEQFIKSQMKVAKGFMNAAQMTMGLLDLVSKSDSVARCFTVQPLAKRSAAVMIGFLEGLCGSKSTKFEKVKEYSADPYQLLQRLVNVILRAVQQESSRESGFLCSLAEDPDYNPGTLANVAEVLREDVSYETLASQVEQLMTQITQLQAQQTSAAGNQTAGDTLWQDEVETLVVDDSKLEQVYHDVMSPLQYDEVELEDSHTIKTNTGQAANVNRRKVQALQREMQSWQTDLPCHPNAAAFIRQDEECMDRIRALVTGRPGTPYALGCFFFDIYIPNSYPHDPPVVNFITTGGRTVRFNPNLYEDGKVCLSLIRTFNSSDPSQTWQAGSSTLIQVLVSLQTLVLNEEPRYNEPGYEAERNTPSGNALSGAYNRERHLMTVRFAMLENLRNPPQGFAEVIREHFRVQRDAVLKQCSEWLKLCEDADEERKLRQAVDKLREELQKLEEPSEENKDD